MVGTSPEPDLIALRRIDHWSGSGGLPSGESPSILCGRVAYLPSSSRRLLSSRRGPSDRQSMWLMSFSSYQRNTLRLESRRMLIRGDFFEHEVTPRCYGTDILDSSGLRCRLINIIDEYIYKVIYYE